jgi:hypothetical protein
MAVGVRAFDLNRYVPDFIIREASTFLVEVKPIESDKDPLFLSTCEKIERSGWQDDALIVSWFLKKSLRTMNTSAR